MRILFFPFAALIALTACDDATTASRAVPEQRLHAAREAADVALKARLRTSQPQQRGVQVFAQALSDNFAVCGRSSVSGAAGDPFVPYVAVVSFDGGNARVSNFSLGATGPEASRVFVEMVDRCFDGGGPATNRMMARSFPPLPVPGLPEPQASSVAVAETAAAAPAEAPRPTGTVVTSSRTGANIRSSTRGGEVVRTVPPSSTLEVVGEAPGGWYQVGASGGVTGWVHASVLETAPR
ncbi:MAG: hypothetical protein JWR10_4709 [Rubritepida sp.]|nr:hypothetical protein [Rubritepida sp.]